MPRSSVFIAYLKVSTVVTYTWWLLAAWRAFLLFVEVSLWSYFYNELTQDYLLDQDEVKFSEKRDRMYTFMRIPIELEKVSGISSWACNPLTIVLFSVLRFSIISRLYCLKHDKQNCMAITHVTGNIFLSFAVHWKILGKKLSAMTECS